MKGFAAVFLRELESYFATPLAYVFIVIFLLATGAFTFYVGGLFERGQADLQPFFAFHPWLFLFFAPAVAMRLWAEERHGGTLEILLTLPVPLPIIVLGKFLAAWIFMAGALFLTFPMWLTVAYLGNPDHSVIIGGYLGSLALAGGYLAVGGLMSAFTGHQVTAFVLAVLLSFLFTVSGLPMVLDAFASWAPVRFVDAIASFSFLTHFESIAGGVLTLDDFVFFLSFITISLAATCLVIEIRK
jgi:ABC-2 type transport system permease protein